MHHNPIEYQRKLAELGSFTRKGSHGTYISEQAGDVWMPKFTRTPTCTFTLEAVHQARFHEQVRRHEAAAGSQNVVQEGFNYRFKGSAFGDVIRAEG